jgi:hypothetical protein
LYRYVYLKVDLTTEKLYEHAVKITEKLKSREKEKHLTSRTRKRDKKDAAAYKGSQEDDAGKQHANGGRSASKGLFMNLSRGRRSDEEQGNGKVPS